MAIQFGALRDALIETGATSTKADRAAEALAGYDSRLSGIDVRLEKRAGGQQLLQWMLATNLVVSVGMLWRLLAH